MKTRLVVFLALICSTTAYAQLGWYKIAQKDGGSVNSLVSNSFGDLYCAALNQVYRSVDQGLSWQKLTNPTDTLQAIQLRTSKDSNSALALFAITSGSIFRSTDDGQKWSPMSALNDSIAAKHLVNIYSTRYGELLIATVNGSGTRMHHSRDNGNTFETLCDLSAEPLSVYQAQDSIIYVMTNTGTIRINTDHSTAAVSTTTVTGSNRLIFNGPVDLWGFQGNTPQKSSNKGDTWKSMKLDLPETNGSILSVAVGRDGEAYLFWQSPRDTMRVYRLNNGSSSWTKIKELPFGFNEIIVNTNGTMVASSDLGIFSSEEGAQSWTNTSSGISTYPLAGAVKSSNALAVLGLNGVLSQTNTMGLSWANSNSPFNGIKDVVYHDIMGTTTGTVLVATSGGIIRSTDLGLNYLTTQFKSSVMNSITTSICQVSPTILMASSADGLIKSTDDGATWNVVDTAHAIQFLFSRGNSVVYASTTKGVYSADSNGANFQLVGADVPSGHILVNNAGVIYCAAISHTGSTYDVHLYRKAGGPVEDIKIPSNGKTLPPIRICTDQANVYVTSNLGLFSVANGSSTPVKVDVQNEVFTFVRNINDIQSIGTTQYGGVFFLEQPNSVEPESASTDLTIQPQPAADRFTVVCAEGMRSLELYDLRGQLVAQREFSTATDREVIQLPSLSNGVYALVVNTPSGRIVHRRVAVIH